MGKQWTQERRDAAKLAWTPERRKAHGDRMRGKRKRNQTSRLPNMHLLDSAPVFFSEEWLIWALTDIFAIGLRRPEKRIAVDNAIKFFRAELDRLRAGAICEPLHRPEAEDYGTCPQGAD